MRKILTKIKRGIFHRLKLYPIYKVIRRINAHFPLQGSMALEAFAFTGELQTRAYKKYPKYLEAWEISANWENDLKRNLPNATIKITNTFEEILRCDKKFNFINVDTHQGLFGDYCENFEIFPLLFNVMQNECIVNLNVIPNASEGWKRKYPDLFNEKHLAKRKKFYQTEHPENVSIQEMLVIYGEIAAKYDYSIIWSYHQQRTLTYYLVIHLKKNK